MMSARSPRLALALIAVAAVALAAAGAFAPRADAGPGDRRVPEVIDLPVAAAEAELAAAGFGADRRDAPLGGGPAGTVAGQLPGGFAFAPPGARISIFVRGGSGGAGGPGVGPAVPPPVTPPAPPTIPGGPPTAPAAQRVPNVTGKTETEAIELLAGWRITILTVDSVPENAGRVTHQEPAAGSALPPDGVVEISVGRSGTPGADAGTALVPSVLGFTTDAASQALTAVQLVPLVQPAATSDPAKAGKVIAQDPQPGTVVARNSNVVVTVGTMAASPLNEAEVPDCTRQPEGAARRRLADAGFPVQVRDRLASAAENGVVLEQDPAPMARLLRGRTVTLTVGRLLLLPVNVPDVLNVDAAAAERSLREAGFEVETVLADTLPSGIGRVVAQEPPGNTGRVRGSFVRITVGRTSVAVPSTVPVPNVVGAADLAASDELAARGFAVRRTIVAAATADDGKVLSQRPVAGTPAPRGSEVTITIGRAAVTPGVTVPSYVNMNVATAQADLAAKGLRVNVVYATGSPDGRVLDQQPPPGSVTVRGALVTLTVARVPALGVPMLLEPANAASYPRNHGLVFRWGAVPDAEDYQIEVMSWKDGAWQRESQYEKRELFMKVDKTRKGFYQWHVRARRAGGTVEGAWSEMRRVTIY